MNYLTFWEKDKQYVPRRLYRWNFKIVWKWLLFLGCIKSYKNKDRGCEASAIIRFNVNKR